MKEYIQPMVMIIVSPSAVEGMGLFGMTSEVTGLVIVVVTVTPTIEPIIVIV